MSVIILPYINEVNKTDTVSTGPQTLDVQMDVAVDSFRDVLAAAQRTQQAMAVDVLLSAQNFGKISPETVQKMLGFNPQPNIPAANAATVSSTQSTETAALSVPSSDAQSVSASVSASSATDLDAYFEEAAQKYNVDVKLLKAIAHAESNYNPNATSSSGAMGVMQLMPSTAKSLGITDAYNARDNIMGGAKVISDHLSRYDGDLSLALAAYNAGSGNVAKYGGVPPFTETQNYIKKVLSYYEGA